jgi:hypothetical protein
MVERAAVEPTERRHKGEQHCGERPNKDVRAGPQAKQDCEAQRCRLDRSEAWMPKRSGPNGSTNEELRILAIRHQREVGFLP